MSELHHECGIAAIYHLPNPRPALIDPLAGRGPVSHLMPRILLDLQNRGQLAAKGGYLPVENLDLRGGALVEIRAPGSNWTEESGFRIFPNVLRLPPLAAAPVSVRIGRSSKV